ncbi:hypothetical protein JR044_31010 [Pseudomonas aeruginosa]|uniref:hypothetical protein n=1 Tax=Pseudomonas aeruginosa TaxID=287 RepID=UPI001BD1F2D8|nr:hypothetical protein [Pseudomonas aeruginosa]MBS9758425.1 hypothetical protein [Pseudomonas aeruginosa]
MKSVRAFLPGSPEAAVYAGLTEHAPAAPYKPAGHEAGRRPRRLTDKQRATFLGTAAARVTEEARDRAGRWLRRLDTIHKSGCRTKQQRWDALAAMAEPLFARVDVATLCLGYLLPDGSFRLNRQRGLAQDGSLTECRVSRTLDDLETAGYVRRRVRRIFKNGRHWVSRVTIHLRPRFFIDLGLAHKLAEARTQKKAQRASKLREAAARQQQGALQELADRQQRRESHRRAEGARQARAEQQANVRRIDDARARADLTVRLASENPGMTPAELRELLDRLHPPA